MKAELYLSETERTISESCNMLDVFNDQNSNESSTTVNRLQTEHILPSRDREPSRIPGGGGKCLF